MIEAVLIAVVLVALAATVTGYPVGRRKYGRLLVQHEQAIGTIRALNAELDSRRRAGDGWAMVVEMVTPEMTKDPSTDLFSVSARINRQTLMGPVTLYQLAQMAQYGASGQEGRRKMSLFGLTERGTDEDGEPVTYHTTLVPTGAGMIDIHLIQATPYNVIDHLPEVPEDGSGAMSGFDLYVQERMNRLDTCPPCSTGDHHRCLMGMAPCICAERYHPGPRNADPNVHDWRGDATE